MIFTNEIKLYIKENYKGVYNDDLAKMINNKFGTDLSRYQVKEYKKRNSLKSGVKGIDKALESRKRPLGTIRKDKSGYEMTKVNYFNGHRGWWEYSHKLLWQKHNGPLKSGERVMFADGNKKNITIDNLLKVTNEELGHMIGNKYITDCPERTKVGLGISRLNIAINKRTKYK